MPILSLVLSKGGQKKFIKEKHQYNNSGGGAGCHDPNWHDAKNKVYVATTRVQ